MKHLAERPGLSFGRDGLEEAAAQELTLLADAALRQEAFGIRKHLRLLDQDASHVRTPLQDGCQQRARAPSHVDDGVHGSPVIGFRDLLVFVRTQVRERPIEHLVLLREPAHALPERLAKHVVEARLSGPHAVAEGPGGLHQVIGAPEQNGIPETTGAVAEERRDGVVGEDTRRDFLECPKGSERAQAPGQGQLVEPGTLRQIRCGHGTVVQMVRHAALDEGVEYGCEIQVGQQAERGLDAFDRRRLGHV